ncbi:MAG: EscU/YscU/HrcU family type III secretion system export apparatus switch protein [Deltaproteobacteria bacterium]|nr:EscU/YscU/HrcU family type III secretion system export apparatus switch protein [Deltaproteobacteria bacterium]
MAEQQTSQEKTEEATPRRRRDARKKGQVAKSRDVNTILILIAAFGLLAAMGHYISDIFQLSMKEAFEFASKTNINNEELFLHAEQAFFDYLKAAMPFVGLIAFIALAVGFAQVGPVFSGEPMKLKGDRLNIITNLKNMFKITTFIELLKNVAKVTLIFILAYMVLKDNMREVVMTVLGTLPQSTAVAAHVITSFLIKVFICFVVIAFVDLAVQRWQYKKQLRMSKEEVKREYKEDEGDPLIKSMRKHLYQEMLMSDVKQAVKTSDVVITNPTELAIALKYDDKAMVAPQIMAKGQRLFAEMIRDTAKELNIPIMQNVPLAWALIEMEIGDEIPENLYAAVAEALLIVYRMKERQG